jgi:hypothetical protein
MIEELILKNIESVHRIFDTLMIIEADYEDFCEQCILTLILFGDLIYKNHLKVTPYYQIGDGKLHFLIDL